MLACPVRSPPVANGHSLDRSIESVVLLKVRHLAASRRGLKNVDTRRGPAMGAVIVQCAVVVTFGAAHLAAREDDYQFRALCAGARPGVEGKLAALTDLIHPRARSTLPKCHPLYRDLKVSLVFSKLYKNGSIVLPY